MKRLIIFSLLLMCCNSAIAYNYNEDITNNIIKDEQQVKFCPDSQLWGDSCTAANQIIFTKRITYGSGGFSIYEKDRALYDTDTTLEFLIDNKLYGYNMHKLKFFNMEFKDNKFINTELTEEEIQNILPDIKIIKVSQFNNREITLYKPFFKPKSFILINDTSEFYYKYQLENYNKQDEIIHGIFEIDKAGDYIYSHFGSRDTLFPTLTIHIRNSFTEK